MSKKNKNKKKYEDYNPYNISVEEIENLMVNQGNHAIYDEDESTDYMNSHNIGNRPATAENLQMAAEYDDFINGVKEPKKPKKKKDDMDSLKELLRGSVEEGKGSDDNFLNEFLSGDYLDEKEDYPDDVNEEEHDGIYVEYDPDDPYNVNIEDVKIEEKENVVIPEVKEETIDATVSTIKFDIDAEREMTKSSPQQKPTMKNDDEYALFSDTDEYMLLSEMCALNYEFLDEIGRIIIDDKINPFSIIDKAVASKSYFDFDESSLIGLIINENVDVTNGGATSIAYEKFLDMRKGLILYITANLHPCAVFKDYEFFEAFSEVQRIDTNAFKFFFEGNMYEDGLIFAYHIPKAKEDNLRRFVSHTANLILKNENFLADYPGIYYKDKNGCNVEALSICAELLVYIYIAKLIRDTKGGFIYGNKEYINGIMNSRKLNMRDNLISLIRRNSRTKIFNTPLTTPLDGDDILSNMGAMELGYYYDMGDGILDFFEGTTSEDDGWMDVELDNVEENALTQAYDEYKKTCAEEGTTPFGFIDFVRMTNGMAIKNVDIQEIEEETETKDDINLSAVEVDAEEVVPELPDPEPEIDSGESIGSDVMKNALTKAITEETQTAGKLVIPVRRKS